MVKIYLDVLGDDLINTGGGGVLVLSGKHGGVGVSDCFRLFFLDGDVDLSATRES